MEERLSRLPARQRGPYRPPLSVASSVGSPDTAVTTLCATGPSTGRDMRATRRGTPADDRPEGPRDNRRDTSGDDE